MEIELIKANDPFDGFPEEELNVLGLQHIVELVQMMKIRLKVIIR